MTDRGVSALRATAADVAQVPRATLVAAVEEVKRLADGAAPPFTPRRYRLWSFDELSGPDEAVRARVQGVPVGFWVIASYGARGHTIPGRKSGRRSKAPRLPDGRRLLSFGPNAGAAWGPVHHPGAGGRGYWQQVVDRATPLVFERFDLEVEAAIDA